MKKSISISFLLIFCWNIDLKAQDILIVADEIPAMEVLAKAFRDSEQLDCKIIKQAEIPTSLADYQAVIVYIHKELLVDAEKKFIDYTKNGGHLICLHHTISTFKKTNKDWLNFLGVELPKKDVKEGGYKYVGNINMEVVNLAPKHFITTNKIKYPTKIAYTREGETKEEKLDGFELPNTEAYINQNSLSPRIILMGLRFKDKTDQIWMQDQAVWYMPVEKGWLFYSQPGHAVSDFENQVYARIIMNAVLYPWKEK
jgi:Trehalose utilisation